MIRKLGLSGATGKMGLEIAALVAGGDTFFDVQFELADAVAGSHKISSVEGVEVRTLSEPSREPVHLWIDFSQPAATMKLLEQIKGPILIGTTGFTPEQKEKISAYAKEFPVLLASNTSPGMNVMKRMLRTLPSPKTLASEMVLLEEHHRRKKDSPSGTAKTLLEVVKDRGFDDVPVHVTRAGDIIGVHKIHWITDGEEIVIEHRVSDRKIFAKGALAGAAYLLKQTPGLHSMENVFGGES